jgi:hypothetical protein
MLLGKTRHFVYAHAYILSFFSSLNVESQHNPLPWVSYWLGTVLAAYRELESRVGAMATGHGTKADIVIARFNRLDLAFNECIKFGQIVRNVVRDFNQHQ